MALPVGIACPHAPPPRQEQRGCVDLVPSAVCGATGITDVTELWPAGTSEVVMIHSIESILLRFERMMRTEIHHDFWVQNPWLGVFDCLERRLLWNAARSSRKKTSSYSAMINPVDPCRFMHFDHHGRWLAEHFHYVPVLVWWNADCKNEFLEPLGNGIAVGQGQWWPMIVNPWTPAWNIFNEIDPNLIWSMCPALAINGGRPWPVHKDRLRVLTDRILANKPEKVEKAETAPTPSEIDTSAPSENGTACPSEIGTASSPSDSSWQVITDASSDTQSDFF